jgi:drug/metabolite transporter (DMT)-like permease
VSAPKSSLGADLSLLGITAIWGATFVTVKSALVDAAPMAFLSVRFLLGAATTAALARGHLRDPKVWRHGVVLGVLLFGGYALQTLGLEYTSPAKSAFLTGLTVIFVPFAASVVARVPPAVPTARVPGVTYFSIGLAAVGLWLLTGVDVSVGLSKGDALTLGCAVVYAFHVSATSRLGQGVHPVALVTVQLLVTAGLSLATLPFVDRRLEPSLGLVGAVLLTGLIASALAISVQVWAQTKTPAVRAAVIYSLEPAFAVAYGVVFGDGWPSAHELWGGALVVAAVLVAEVGAALARRYA